MATMVLYSYPTSAPSRAVKMTAQILNIELDVVEVDLRKDEHLKPPFVKMNHLKKVPVLVDKDFVLSESRAIMGYLINTYSPNHSLYPEDPQKRATIDQMLYFDVQIYDVCFDWLHPVLFLGKEENPDRKKAAMKIFAVLEKIIGQSPYMAADHVTIADLSILAALGFMDVADYKFDGFPKLKAWFMKMKSEVPKYKEINDKPLNWFKDIIRARK